MLPSPFHSPGSSGALLLLVFTEDLPPIGLLIHPKLRHYCPPNPTLFSLKRRTEETLPFFTVHAWTLIMVCPLAVTALKRISGVFGGHWEVGVRGLWQKYRKTLGGLWENTGSQCPGSQAPLLGPSCIGEPFNAIGQMTCLTEFYVKI